jgi:hypothetical protein
MPRNEQEPSCMQNSDIPRLQIIEDREIRSELLKLKKKLDAGTKSRERSIAITKIQEAYGWLDMDECEIREKFPNAAPR